MSQVAVVSFPPPTLPGRACSTCEGVGVTGERYRMQLSPDEQPLLVDVFCPRCGGCGRAEHDDETCTAREHAEDDDSGYDDEDDLDDVRCWSCRDRGWWSATGWPVDADRSAVGDEVVTLRMPCGCTSGRVELIPDLSGVPA